MAFERHFWPGGANTSLSLFGSCLEVENINSQKANDFLANFDEELSLCFGNQKICPKILLELRLSTFNWHY